jgi:SAM-dependent methyltransferase
VASTSDHSDPTVNRRWARWRRDVDLDSYANRFAEMEATGEHAHGEADAVARLLPTGGSVLDAGCGMGRVAVELDRQGFDVLGVDVDPEMLAVARSRRPDLRWGLADIGTVDLGRTFDLVLLAGNVMLFVPEGTESTVVANMARHVAAGGRLVAGFSLAGSPVAGIGLAEYDAFCVDAGLELIDRWATWDGDPYPGESADRPVDYAVSIHRLHTQLRNPHV